MRDNIPFVIRDIESMLKPNIKLPPMVEVEDFKAVLSWINLLADEIGYDTIRFFSKDMFNKYADKKPSGN